MLADRRIRTFVDTRVLSRLAGIPLMSRKPMQGNVSGRHPSPHRGASVEFAEYRKYVPGDDLRRLDWRAYGRSDRFYVKEFEADTNLRCCLVLDTSGSMGFGSKNITKIEFGRRIAAALGWMAVQQGDAVGLSCVADGIVSLDSAAAKSGAFENCLRSIGACQAERGNAARFHFARTGRDIPPTGTDRHHFGFLC